MVVKWLGLRLACDFDLLLSFLNCGRTFKVLVVLPYILIRLSLFINSFDANFQAAVTSHLVLRGCYRSLSMVIYGNTAEDLGQFNIEVDLDSSLHNLVSSSEAKLDDLPPALHLKDLTVDDSIFSVDSLNIMVPPAYISIEVKQLLQLLFRIFEIPNLGDKVDSLVNILVSAAASFAAGKGLYDIVNRRDATNKKSTYELIQARQDILALVQNIHESGYLTADLLADITFLESDGNLVAPKQLMDMFSDFAQFINSIQHLHLSKVHLLLVIHQLLPILMPSVLFM